MNEEQKATKRFLIYANHLTDKNGNDFINYRVKNEALDKFVNVIFCREAKDTKPLQSCYVVVEDDKNCYNFGKDKNGYDVMFLSKVVAYEPLQAKKGE